MIQAGTVARLATRELWMTFRLLLVLIVSVGAGVVVSVLPAPVTEAMLRLAIGLGAAIIVGAAVAAWSIAEERLAGRAGWLVTRSVARPTYLAGWYVAVLLAAVVGLAAGALLGWLAIPAGSVAVDPLEYVVVIAAVAATLAAAIAIGLLAGALLRPTAAMAVAVLACAVLAVVVASAPIDASWLPGGALTLLPRTAGSEPVVDEAIRAAGIALASAAALLVACRVAFERSDL